MAGQQAMAVEPQVYAISRVSQLPDRNISQTPDTDGADPNKEYLVVSQRLSGRFDLGRNELLKAVAQGLRILIAGQTYQEVMNERRRPQQGPDVVAAQRTREVTETRPDLVYDFWAEVGRRQALQ